MLKQIDRNFWILWAGFFVFTAIPDFHTYQRCLAIHDYRGVVFLTAFHIILPFIGLLVYYAVCPPEQRRNWDAWLPKAKPDTKKSIRNEDK